MTARFPANRPTTGFLGMNPMSNALKASSPRFATRPAARQTIESWVAWMPEPPGPWGKNAGCALLSVYVMNKAYQTPTLRRFGPRLRSNSSEY